LFSIFGDTGNAADEENASDFNFNFSNSAHDSPTPAFSMFWAITANSLLSAVCDFLKVEHFYET